MDFGKREDGTPKTFTDVEAEAFTQALREDSKKSEEAKEGCMVFFVGIVSHLINALLLMFLVALLGHPLGYLVCLLAVYTVSSVIGVSSFGEYRMLHKIYKQLGGK